MSPVALGLVLTAAVLHASWNLLAKQVPSGLPFVALVSACGVLLWAPVAAVVAVGHDGGLSALAWGLVLGSAALHIGYFLALQYGYRRGELSVTYPIARGSAPVAATAGAVVVLGERPSALGVLGLGLLVVGVVGLSRGGQAATTGRLRSVAPGALVGVSVGMMIAVYTVWDAYAIQVALVPPLLFTWLSDVFRTGLLTVPAISRWGEVSAVWRDHRWRVLAVAVLSPLSYALVLLALQTSDVSQVAPLRESSVLIGVLLGARVLGERQLGLRLVAAAAIFAGILALASS